MNNEYYILLLLLQFNWYLWVLNFVDFVKFIDFGYMLNCDCDLWLYIFIW